jgi:hypothetical protein
MDGPDHSGLVAVTLWPPPRSVTGPDQASPSTTMLDLGVGGHLGSLRRTRVGKLMLDEAQTLEDAGRELRIMQLDRVVRSSFPTLAVHETQVGQIRNRSAVGWRAPARWHNGPL